eukprot:m.197589 g.197589  ORF g.197589 m.197589 type:complete len:108 (+) comp10647_c2_seq2:1623-1946(+)
MMRPPAWPRRLPHRHRHHRHHHGHHAEEVEMRPLPATGVIEENARYGELRRPAAADASRQYRPAAYVQREPSAWSARAPPPMYPAYPNQYEEMYGRNQYPVWDYEDY